MKILDFVKQLGIKSYLGKNRTFKHIIFNKGERTLPHSPLSIQCRLTLGVRR